MESDASLAKWALLFIGYSARQAKPCQPMTGEKGHHSSAQADKNPAATGFWAAAVTRLLSLYVERVSL
jgi:hypothetical protein